MKKSIQIRAGGKVVSKANRKLYFQQIGNFNPAFCHFENKTYQIKSDAGDFSDPFRREENYLETLFIELEKPCQWKL
jgi:hypothetical protein